MTLHIESKSFGAGEHVPGRHAFGVRDGNGKAKPAGGNVSPHLRWSGAPAGTRSFAIACVDEDVPAELDRMNQEEDTIEPGAERQPFAHWLVVDVPPDVVEIPEGAGGDGIVPHGKPTGETSFGGRTGANGFTGFLAGDDEMEGTYGNYDGPFPPWNDELEHRYRFRVYALDVERIDLPEDFGLEQFRDAIAGHVLDEGEHVGRYSLHETRTPTEKR
ncbi:MAG TPA: YbhB/YbcL family Raf kinase inhibitor-like protein [Gaiellaceae bacterium]|jgi:Raf kinase inhibitor-like YbhB/YbcL family protein|nr:YbhB/YbcL family Raf kinase inhibitor-like protein [Gaiellaceae bacterium]